jgi:glycosyltransferase involved in cell wall biosynthesis
MKILLIHQYFLQKNESGGSRWNEMAKMWGEMGHEVTVIGGMVHYSTGKKDEKFKNKFVYREDYEKNVEVFRTHVSEAYNVNFLGRLWGYFSFVFSSIFCGLFKLSGKYDAIVVSSPPLFIGITGIVLSKFKGIPLFFEIRDLWPESAIDTGVVTNKYIIKLAYWLEKKIYESSKHIIVLTPAFMEKLISIKSINPKKISYFPNAADFSISEKYLGKFDIDNFRDSNGIPKDKIVITYVGAHGVANNLIQIVETANLLKDFPVFFLLIGDGMEKKMLVDEAQKLQLTNLKFLPPVSKEEVFKFIIASDIGTSVLKKVDTFKTVYSNKTFDYMGCRKPILMAIDGVSKVLVEQADAGLFVEPENPIDFAEKIKVYINNPALLFEHGNNGYKFAKSNFDRGVLGSNYINKIEGILKNQN